MSAKTHLTSFLWDHKLSYLYINRTLTIRYQFNITKVQNMYNTYACLIMLRCFSSIPRRRCPVLIRTQHSKFKRSLSCVRNWFFKCDQSASSEAPEKSGCPASSPAALLLTISGFIQNDKQGRKCGINFESQKILERLFYWWICISVFFECLIVMANCKCGNLF